jgi:hypothetical protein
LSRSPIRRSYQESDPQALGSDSYGAAGCLKTESSAKNPEG